MKQRKHIVCVCALIMCASVLSAQDNPSRFQESVALITDNPDRAANNRHSYEFIPIKDTKAPKGFKPFYISHYGRHGSRFESNTDFSSIALAGFAKLDSLGLLTEEGKAAYRDVKAVTDEHLGLEGALSPRGGREQQMLAKRMVSRFPEVFSDKRRNFVSCMASTVQRCIVSMNYFSVSMKGEVPDLEFSFASGPKYQYYMSPSIDYSKLFSVLPRNSSSSVDEYDCSRIYRLFFKDVERALAELPNPVSFVNSVFEAGTFCQDLDYLGIDIFRDYFTTDDHVHFWIRQNDMIYLLWGNSLENGDNVKKVARPLLKDFLDKADSAMLPGSNCAADLRFGHDAGVLPLLSLLGLDDPDSRRYNYHDAHNHWFSYQQIPMGTNFQMIFYRNKKNEIIVKFLHNERECHLANIPAYNGPYYRWNDVRSWFLSLCE